MIELDGTAYPLERGQNYIFLYRDNTISKAAIQQIGQLAKERWDVSLLCIAVRGTPADVVIRGPIAVEVPDVQS